MNSERFPKTDSIIELAQFWDTHDLTDFEGELEEVDEPVFDRETTISVHLEKETANAVAQIAKTKGFPAAKLIEIWVTEKVTTIPPNSPVSR